MGHGSNVYCQRRDTDQDGLNYCRNISEYARRSVIRVRYQILLSSPDQLFCYEADNPVVTATINTCYNVFLSNAYKSEYGRVFGILQRSVQHTITFDAIKKREHFKWQVR